MEMGIPHQAVTAITELLAKVLGKVTCMCVARVCAHVCAPGQGTVPGLT